MIRRLAEEGACPAPWCTAAPSTSRARWPTTPTQDAEGQTADILRQIDALLREAGTDKRYLLSVQIFIRDLADFPGLNRAWDAWLDPAAKPARATVEARLANPDWRVEITGIAALPPVYPAPAQPNESLLA